MALTLGLQFPCKHSSNGCDFTSRLTEKAIHENYCRYGLPYCCPHVCGHCQWFGSREEVAQHLIDRHEYPIKESSNHNWIFNLENQKEFNVWISILSFKDQKFIFIRKFGDDRKQLFKAIVLFVGEQKEANKFKYKIEIINKSNGTRLEWEDKPISIRNDIKLLLTFNQNKGLNIGKNSIKRLTYGNNFNIMLTIESINDISLMTC